MGWYSKSKKRIRRSIKPRKVTYPYRPHPTQRYRKRDGKKFTRYRDYSPAYRYYKSPTRRRYAGKMKRFNRQHQVVGLTPNYLLSPIDAVPVVGPAAKGYRGYKYTRKSARAVVNVVKAGSREYSRRRGRTKSSRKGRRRRRGTYYYYRGKRIYRK